MAGRLTAVTVLTLVSIVLWAPDVTRPFGHPLGTPGFSVGPGGAVLTLDRGSPAERIGIRVGQHIDWRGTPLHSRIILISGNETLHPIHRFPVRVITQHGAVTAMVTSEPEAAADYITVLPRIVFQLILLAAGIALVLLRPRKATWGFFVFTLFCPTAPVNAFVWLGPPAYQLAASMLLAATPIISNTGIIIFALYLLIEPPVARWRRTAEVSAYAIAFTAVALIVWSTLAAVLYAAPSDAANISIVGLEIGTALAVPLLLAATYASSCDAVRERLRWLLFGLSLNALFISFLVVTANAVTYVAIPYWLFAIFSGIDTVVVASTVLYAVLKHHVIDINVAISRALVYTILSALAVGVFALVDLFFTRALSTRNAGLMVDIGLALILGFFFNTAHARVDRFVDRVLFRSRHTAESHVRAVIRGMPFVLTEAQVDRLLVEEPLRSFGLLGATLFTCGESQEFALQHSAGMPVHVSIPSREDSLSICLQGERCALRLNEHGFDSHAVAVPVFSHGDLTAIAVYGLHANGTDLDSEEIMLFELLAAAAGNAYDRLEAKSLREEVGDLRDEVRELRLTRA